MDKRIKIKISQNTSYKNASSNQVSIAYSSRKIDNSDASYEILSSLISGSDIIIELNSSLLNLAEREGKLLVSTLIDAFEDMGIQYKKKKIAVSAKKTILSIIIESKKQEGFELSAYIPHEIWCTQEFKNIIPDNGALRYYLPKAETEIDFDAFSELDEDEKSELCRMVIFNHILLGSMGINTSVYDKNDIAEILNK